MKRGLVRRNRSEPRERLLAYLRETQVHPTAAQAHEELARETPSLSLGTVYRNLEILVGEGLVDAVPSASGSIRYDGNLKPHHHFICEGCGAIDDVALRLPPTLERGLKRARGREARRIKVNFFGVCEACESHASPR